MPKRGCDVATCEIAKFYRLNNSGLCQVRPVWLFLILNCSSIPLGIYAIIAHSFTLAGDSRYNTVLRDCVSIYKWASELVSEWMSNLVMCLDRSVHYNHLTTYSVDY